MDADRWQRVQDIVMAALEREPHLRQSFVLEACDGDSELLSEVVDLLENDPDTEFLEDSGVAWHQPDVDPRIGTSVKHYRLLEKLGEGGMGSVYKALDTNLGRHVALKLLHPHLAWNRGARARFLREARTASALNHRNICTTHEIGQTDEGSTYITMAFYEGETLRARLDRGPVDPHVALDLVAQLAQGLRAAHEGGIVHRDIKPANLLITPDGELKIADFGIAKFAGLSPTVTVGTLGTVTYMSPEQIEAGHVDGRTDIWSVGIVFYEMLSGKVPFKEDSHSSTMYAILHAEPNPIALPSRDLPPGIDNVLRKALAKDQEQRYATINELLADLGRIAEGKPESIKPPKTRRWSTGQGIRLGLLAAFIVVAGALAISLAYKHEDAPSPQSPVPLPSPGNVVVFPFQDESLSPSTDLGTSIARLLSEQIYSSGVVTSVDFNRVVAATSGTDVLDPEQADQLSARLDGSHFMLGTVNREGDQISVNASLYTRDGRPAARFAATRDSSDVSGLADEILHDVLPLWEQKMERFHAITRQSIKTAAQTTKSGAALKAFTLGVIEKDERHFDRALEIDSTFALIWFIRGRNPYASEWTRRQMLRYRSKLPPVEQGLVDIHLQEDRAFERINHMYIALLNEWRDDGLLWLEYGEFLFRKGYRSGRVSTDARPALERGRDLTGIPHFMLAEIGLLERDETPMIEAIAYEHVVGDTAGRFALWYQGELTLAGYRQDYRRLDSLLSERKRFHPARLLSSALQLLQFGKEINAARQITKYMIEAPEMTDDWRLLGRIIDANVDMAAGKTRQGTDKLLSVADRNVAFLGDLIAQRIVDLSNESPEFWGDMRDRIERWDTLTERSLVQSWDPHDGVYSELREFLGCLIAYRLKDVPGFQDARARLSQIADQKGQTSAAAAMGASMDALETWEGGRGEEALAILEQSRRKYRPTYYAPASAIMDQMIDRYLRAEILFNSGRYEEALPWYLSINDKGSIWVYGSWAIGPAYLRAAEIYEATGQTKLAIENLKSFVQVWTNADPDLQPYVEKARERLEVLLQKQV